jgi:hypothetical protein
MIQKFYFEIDGKLFQFWEVKNCQENFLFTIWERGNMNIYRKSLIKIHSRFVESRINAFILFCIENCCMWKSYYFSLIVFAWKTFFLCKSAICSLQWHVLSKAPNMQNFKAQVIRYCFKTVYLKLTRSYLQDHQKFKLNYANPWDNPRLYFFTVKTFFYFK